VPSGNQPALNCISHLVLNARCLIGSNDHRRTLHQQVINRCHQAAPTASGPNHRVVLSLKGSALETVFMWEPQRCDYSL
jgi:hypothetical protein